MALALQRSLLAPRQIDAVIAHGTGTKANDAAESAAIHGLLADTPVTAPKGSLGHTGGACGAFQLLAALGCLRHQTLPSIGGLTCLDERLPIQPALKSRAMPLKRLLVNCFGFGGSNVSMVCAAVHGERYHSIWNARRRTLQDVDPPKRPSPRMRQTVTLSGPNTIPQPRLSRWMDDLSVQALALADRLMERDHESWAGRYDVGIVLSVDEGARIAEPMRCGSAPWRGEAAQSRSVSPCHAQHRPVLSDPAACRARPGLRLCGAKRGACAAVCAGSARARALSYDAVLLYLRGE